MLWGLNEKIHEKCCAQGLVPSKHPINVPLRRKTKRDWRGKPGREVNQEITAKLQRQEVLRLEKTV